MASEEIKLAKNVHSETAGAEASGMIPSGCSELSFSGCF
jgi:hypothetical protein